MKRAGIRNQHYVVTAHHELMARQLPVLGDVTTARCFADEAVLASTDGIWMMALIARARVAIAQTKGRHAMTPTPRWRAASVQTYRDAGCPRTSQVWPVRPANHRQAVRLARPRPSGSVREVHKIWDAGYEAATAAPDAMGA